MARRGTVRTIWWDNEKNSGDARNKLQQRFKEMKHKHIKIFLQENVVDWILWPNKSLGASHMGGVWKRQI